MTGRGGETRDGEHWTYVGSAQDKDVQHHLEEAQRLLCDQEGAQAGERPLGPLRDRVPKLCDPLHDATDCVCVAPNGVAVQESLSKEDKTKLTLSIC
jgi:hypothetical protein